MFVKKNSHEDNGNLLLLKNLVYPVPAFPLRMKTEGSLTDRDSSIKMQSFQRLILFKEEF